MVTLVPSLLLVVVVQAALASNACISSNGPSPYEYSIDKQMTYRENVRNLLAGWRQYDDKLLYKKNITISRNSNYGDKYVLRFPSNGLDGRQTITHVVSLDKSGNSYGAVAYIGSGGIGFKRVLIGYNYRPNYGMVHSLEIYGI